MKKILTELDILTCNYIRKIYIIYANDTRKPLHTKAGDIEMYH
jgi:hypothetical protein